VTRIGESFTAYVLRRANDIARGFKAVMQGHLETELAIEDQDNEDEAQIETLVLAFNLMVKELDSLNDIAQNELNRAKEYIRRQQETIRELSTPVIEIWDDILMIPIVGALESARTNEMTTILLDSITTSQAKFLIIDLTGVDAVDTRTASNLTKIVQAVSLLGTRCILTGLSPGIAQTFVHLGTDMSHLLTIRNLKEGLRYCMRHQGSSNRNIL